MTRVSTPLSTRPLATGRERDSASRPAQHDRRTTDDPRDRVIAVNLDGAIVHQEKIADAPEPLLRIIILVCHGLAARVCTRHHQGTRDGVKQEVMQWGVR